MTTEQVNLTEICENLRQLQRRRSVLLKSLNMNENRLVAAVRSHLGFNLELSEDEKLANLKAARDLIKEVSRNEMEHPYGSIIMAMTVGMDALKKEMKKIEDVMTDLAEQLPVAEWLSKPEQKGFGVLSLAKLIGETGDLNNYSNHSKVWARMGLLPWAYDNKVQMGSTWKSKRNGSLPAEEWVRFGYCSRRRVEAHLLSKFIPMSNKSIYRDEYTKEKTSFAARHPESKPMRAHLHALMMVSKLAIRNLWNEWTKREPTW